MCVARPWGRVAVCLWRVVCFVGLVVLFCLVCGDVTVKEM